MAKFALLSMYSSDPVRADKVPDPDRKRDYFCATPGCNARMFLCAPGDHAYFSSYRKSDHKYAFCTDSSLTFKPDSYDENLFDLDNAIRHICTSTRSRNIHYPASSVSTVSSSVGKGKKIPIQTAKTLFSMCETIGVNGSYNGVKINDIYACDENSDSFILSHERFCIIECTYWKCDSKNNILYFNFPKYIPGKSVHVAVNLPEKDLRHKFFNILNRVDSSYRHKVRFVVCAVWHSSSLPDTLAECDICKMSQVFLIPH